MLSGGSANGNGQSLCQTHCCDCIECDIEDLTEICQQASELEPNQGTRPGKLKVWGCEKKGVVILNVKRLRYCLSQNSHKGCVNLRALPTDTSPPYTRRKKVFSAFLTASSNGSNHNGYHPNGKRRTRREVRSERRKARANLRRA